MDHAETVVTGADSVSKERYLDARLQVLDMTRKSLQETLDVTFVSSLTLGSVQTKSNRKNTRDNHWPADGLGLEIVFRATATKEALLKFNNGEMYETKLPAFHWKIDEGKILSMENQQTIKLSRVGIDHVPGMVAAGFVIFDIVKNPSVLNSQVQVFPAV